MPPTRDRVATSALFFANGFGFGGWSAAIAPMQASLRLSNAELGLLLFTLAAGAEPASSPPAPASSSQPALRLPVSPPAPGRSPRSASRSAPRTA